MSATMGAPTTPTSRTPASSASTSLNATTSGLEDINYLLYLETVKRFKDEEAHIRRQVEEKTRQYQEIKLEYLQQYAKYVSLVKLAATHDTLERGNFLDDGQIDAALVDVTAIAQKLSQGSLTDYIDSDELAQCKQLLSNDCHSHDNLRQLRRELADNKIAVRAIQAATEAVEATVETATMQGLNHFVETLQLEDTEKSPKD